MAINQRQKGKRVELELAHWLESFGIKSARRTQQFCGDAGDSDVTAEELSGFFIECKGTQSPFLPRSTLQAWNKKLKENCPKTQLPVIFNKANNHDWIGICPVYVYHRLVEPRAESFPQILGVSGDKINPTQVLEGGHIYHHVWPRTKQLLTCTAGYWVTEEDIFIFAQGSDLLNGMIAYTKTQTYRSECSVSSPHCEYLAPASSEAPVPPQSVG